MLKNNIPELDWDDELNEFEKEEKIDYIRELLFSIPKSYDVYDRIIKILTRWINFREDFHYTLSDKYSQNKYINKDRNDFDLDLSFTLSPLATAKLFIMMRHFQEEEWGAYMKFKTPLPTFGDLFKQEKRNIDILDLILIPQKRSVSDIEYLETLLPEFLTKWKEAKLNNFYVNSGRIHSHHKIGAFHSTTDKEEFNKAFEDNNRFFSIVVAFSDGFNGFNNKDLTDFEEYFSKLIFNSILFIPFDEEIDKKYGYTIEQQIILSEYDQPDIEEAKKWLLDFIKMDKFVKTKIHLIERLDKLKENIDEIVLYYARKIIFENENMLLFIDDLFKLMDQQDKEITKRDLLQTKIDKINDLIKSK